MPKRNAKEDATVVPPEVADDFTVVISEEPTVCSETSFSDTSANPHRIEIDVRHQLTAAPHLHFSSLVVRRIPNGVCLKGVVETDEQSPDICGLVRQVPGVQEVLNHLVVRNLRRPPAKG